MDDENRDRDLNAAKLLRVLFHSEFCVKNSVPDGRRCLVDPQCFYDWLRDNWSSLDSRALSAEAGIAEDTWSFVQDLVLSGVAPQAAHLLWLTISLSNRELPESPVKHVNVVCNLTFADGTIATTQGSIIPEMLRGDKVFDDATLFTALRDTMRHLLDTMVASGLVDLYKDAQKYPYTSTHPNDPFEVFMGWIIRFMLRGEPVPGKLAPELIKPVESYMRLAQQCIRPPVPPGLMAAMQAELKPKPKGDARGGWDV